MIETTELDTTKEEKPVNGHDPEWLKFDSDDALLKHILDQKPTEKIVPIPEWHVEILCQALDPKSRIRIQVAAYSDDVKRTDYRRDNVFAMIVVAGCYNPTTRNHFFTDSYCKTLMSKPGYGDPIERLALTVLRISAMISVNEETDTIKKN